MRTLGVIVVASGLAATAAAEAQTAPPSPPAVDRVEEARRRVLAAMAAFREHDYTTAIHEFELAWRAAPNPDLWYNLARARELASDFEGAVGDYQRYLRDKVDPPDRAEVERHIRELQAIAEHRAAALRRQSDGSQLRLHAAAPSRDARWFLDGGEVAASGEGIAVNPGEHTVRCAAPTRQEWSAQVRVRDGETVGVFAAPAPATRFVTRPTSHVTSLAVAGLGAASLGVAGYFGIRAATAGCDGCSQQTVAASRSDIFLGAGVGLAIGSVVAYFIERASSHTERVAASP